MKNGLVFKYTMNIYLTTLLILSILGLAAFGFLGILCGNGGGHGCCIAEVIAKTVNRQDCPQNNIAAYIDFHFGALKSLSTAVFGASVFASLIFALLGLVLALAIIILEHKINLRLPVFLHYLLREPSEGVFQFKKEHIRWLALHERRDAVLSF